MNLCTALNTGSRIALVVIFTTAASQSNDKSLYAFGFQSNTGNTTYSITRGDRVSSTSISDKISSIIDHLGLNVKDLESILGVKRASIYNWKNGENQPQDNETIAIINKTYELSKLLSSVVEHKFGRLAKTHIYKESDYISKIQNGVSADDIIKHATQLNALISKRNSIPNSVVEGIILSESDDFVIG